MTELMTTYEQRYAFACAVDSVYRTAETTPADAAQMLEELRRLGFEICKSTDAAPQLADPDVSLPDDAHDRMHSFLDALDEWGTKKDNELRAVAIIEFVKGGLDLSEYRESDE